MINKIELIRLVMELHDEGVLDVHEVTFKIREILSRKQMDNGELSITASPEMLEEREKALLGEVSKSRYVQEKPKIGKDYWLTEEEKRYIKENCGKLSAGVIAKNLGRTQATVANWTTKFRKELGITNQGVSLNETILSPKHTWKLEEDNFVRQELEKRTPQRLIADALHVSEPMLKHRIRILRGYKK